MKKKTRGRPTKHESDTKNRYLQVRVEQSEKESFDTAAELAGIPLSIWVRERLRVIAKKELEQHGQTAKFLKK
jgi:head-tail adaptor